MQSVIARVESVLYISYQSYTLIQTTLGVWLGWVWPFLCNYFAVFADTDIVFIIAAMNAPQWSPPGVCMDQWPAIKPSDTSDQRAGLTWHTGIIMLLMTGLMIFNIASLEVSPHQPHPSLYLGIITITAHLLTPQPCLSIIVICQHFSFSSSAHSIPLHDSWLGTFLSWSRQRGAGWQLGWKWGVWTNIPLLISQTPLELLSSFMLHLQILFHYSS